MGLRSGALLYMPPAVCFSGCWLLAGLALEAVAARWVTSRLLCRSAAGWRAPPCPGCLSPALQPPSLGINTLAGRQTNAGGAWRPAGPSVPRDAGVVLGCYAWAAALHVFARQALVQMRGRMVQCLSRHTRLLF